MNYRNLMEDNSQVKVKSPAGAKGVPALLDAAGCEA